MRDPNRENREHLPSDAESFAAAERNAEREPDLRHLLVRGVSRSTGWVCLAIALGAGAGTVAGLVRPDSFVSNAKLLLRVGAREQVTSESLYGFEDGQRAPPPTMVDELQMLSDVDVFERVARKIGPREILQPADPRRDDGPRTPLRVRFAHAIQARCIGWTTPEHECETTDCAECLRAATKVLIEDTDITNELGSNVILVAHTSTSPEKARAIALALTEAFIERHRDQFSVQSVVEKNRDKVVQAKQARDAADELYIESLNQVGFSDIDTQGPALQLEISALEKDLFTAQMRREEISSQRTALSERVKGIPARGETAQQQPTEIVLPPETVLNEEYETQLALKRSLLAQKYSVPLEIRAREEIRLRERDLDEMIAKVDQKLAQIPKTIEQTPKSILRAPVTTAQTRERREVLLTLRLDDLEFEDQALAVRVEFLANRLAERRAQVEEARKLGLVAALRRTDLASARDIEESRYKALLERFTHLESLESIDIEETNLRVLQMPTLDLEKVAPKRFGLFMKGLIAGVLAGLALAILRERFDRRLTYPETFERSRGVPVLAVVPDIRSLRASQSSTAFESRLSHRLSHIGGRWNRS